MNKKIMTWSLCGLAMIALAGCGAKSEEKGQGSRETASVQKEVPAEQEQKGDDSIRGSIKDLLSMGKALKCTWADQKEGISGETYVDGKRTYTHMMNAPVGPSGEKGDSFIITDDAWMYSWSSLSKQGMKMAMTEADRINAEDALTNADGTVNDDAVQESFDMREDYDYSCMPWVVDGGTFTPPADISFLDMNAMMQQMQVPATPTGTPQDLTGICGMLTGEEKAACEAQMQ